MTTGAALAAGLVTSFHCVGMCGPIACGLGTLAKSEGERLTAASPITAPGSFPTASLARSAGVF